MPDLLLELFSEEIPARMQGRAAEDLRRLVTGALVEAGLSYEGAKAFATPRRLALTVHGLPPRQPDRREERKGPRVGAPAGAIAGFLKAAGLASIEEARVQEDPKGAFYVVTTDKPGRTTPEFVAEVLPGIVRSFPWPKSMRWGAASREPGSLRWVRPLHTILCTFGHRHEEPEVVPVAVDGIMAGDTTFGHRFLAPRAFRVRRFEDYVARLDRACVVLDPERRRQAILADARDLALAQNLELVEDPALLDEVAGLVEWPVVLMGAFDAEFLSVPEEVIRTTIRANQKCFVLRDPVRGALANRFILVSNLAAADGGAAIVAGNERVVRARLADARFFWETDKRMPLEERAKKLDAVVFHEKLGTQGERVARIERLARALAPLVGADPNEAAEAARLAKADLMTETVGEFPELQGLVGRYLAAHQGMSPAVAAACEDHYKPQGPADRVPRDPVSITVALADKLDTLVGFWAIDEKPTGSKDPYALRRAALGVIRIVLENGIRGALSEFIDSTARVRRDQLLRERFSLSLDAQVAWAQGLDGDPMLLWPAEKTLYDAPKIDDLLSFLWRHVPANVELFFADFIKTESGEYYVHDELIVLWGGTGFAKFEILDLVRFFADRLKIQLREQGARHDLVDAVFSAGTSSSAPEREGTEDDLVLIVRRGEALGEFLDSEDGRNLLAGFRRAANILRIEEKRDGAGAFDAAPDSTLLAESAERDLAAALETAEAEARRAVAAEDFAAAMRALARLRPAVDAFFDEVTVNAEDPALRANRLKLLNRLRAATRTVADLAKIEG